jgi:Domain of unknown function (DUF1874)
MIIKKLFFLNAPVLTSFGEFQFEKLSLEQAQNLIKEFDEDESKQIESAIGHKATAEVLTDLLSYRVEANRVEFIQTAEDAALVFKLKQRAPEGVVLNREEIEKIGYEFGLLTKRM